ncbi:UNVERIFIED_CONTAM: E3 ubiquitin-protein ligase RGLG1, partial [Sesamum indicum]
MHHHIPVAYNYAPSTPQPRRRMDRKFSRIADNYQTLDQVTAALSRSGLESSNLIVGIDFTKSNDFRSLQFGSSIARRSILQGKIQTQLKEKSLHHIGSGPNPYEQAISIIGKTLSAFDEDNLIPCFGFGDASTHDQDVFSFYPDGRFCEGFEEVLRRYRELVPQLRLSVCEFHRDHVKECGSFKKRGRICSFSIDGNPFSISSYSRAQHTGSGNAPSRAALPPPIGSGNSSTRRRPYSSSSFQRNVPLYPEYETTFQTASSSSSLYDRK